MGTSGIEANGDGRVGVRETVLPVSVVQGFLDSCLLQSGTWAAINAL